jgi:hypothetical protein
MGDMLEKNCPTKEDLHLFLNRATSAEQKDEIELHLASCEGCRRNLSAIFAQSISEMEQFKAPENLVEQVKRLPEERAFAEEKADAQTIPTPWHRQNFFQIALAAGLLVCAGLFGLYFLQIQETAGVPDDVFRNGSGNKKAIKLLTPPENARAAFEKVLFNWSEIAEVKDYTLILSDAKGDIIKEIKTEETNLKTTGAELGLSKGQTYYWQIRAKLKDGLNSESETRKLRITN